MRRRFRLPAALALSVTVPMAGCYTYAVPAQDRPAPGTTVEVTLNDRGRAALEQAIGAEVWQVEGAVASTGDSTFELRVQRTVNIGRQAVRWNGEPVTFRSDFVRSVRERRFSRGRTVVVASVVTIGIITFFATRTLFGFGFGDGSPGDNGNPDGEN